MADYLSLLNQVRSGELTSFEVTPEVFSDFQKAWALFDYQSAIRGVAHQNGHITYEKA